MGHSDRRPATMGPTWFRSGVAVTLLVLGGCQPPVAGNYRAVSRDEIPAGRAVLQIFRLPSVLEDVPECNMRVGQLTVGGLQPGTYTTVFAEAGKTRVETVDTAPAFVTLYLEAGETVFVRQGWHLRGEGLQPVLEHLPAARAEDEIRRCRYVESPDLVISPEDEGGDGGGVPVR